MSKKSRERGEKRRAEAKAQREAIVQQYGLPKSAVETSKPRELGRAMFLSKKEADKFFSAHGTIQKGVKQNDESTWNKPPEGK